MTTNTEPILPTTHDPKVETMAAGYAAFSRGDIGGVLDLLADDIDWAAEPASSSAPWYGSFRGKAGAQAFFEQMVAVIEITDFTPVAYGSNDSDVFAIVRWAYTVRATGRTVEMHLHHWWRFADGKIVRFRGAEDSEQSVSALR